MKEQTTYKKDALNRFSVSDAGKQAAGMYDPGYEHDNCGIGSVVNIKGIKTHETVENALKIVENLKHRAGKDAEGKTGDGVGILLQISHKFFSKAAKQLGIELGEERDYGVGMFFFPQDELKRSQAKKMFEIIVEKEGMKFTFGTADLKGAHPNSVVLHVKGKNGRERKVQACSLGGGRIMINELDGIELNCTCEMPTIVVNHVDQPGRVAEVTTMLSMLSINIATMSVYRDRRGGRAVMVVELDQEIDGSVLNILQSLKGILKVTYISTGGK